MARALDRRARTEAEQPSGLRPPSGDDESLDAQGTLEGHIQPGRSWLGIGLGLGVGVGVGIGVGIGVGLG